MMKFENFYKLLICFLVLIFITISFMSFMSFVHNDIETGFTNLFFAFVSLCNILFVILNRE